MTDFPDLERRIDDALTQLAQPRAPRTLLPRVMAAAAAPAPAPVPAATGWSTWPRVWQGAAAAFALLVAAGFGSLVIEPPAQVAETASSAHQAVVVMRALWELLTGPISTYLFVLGVLLTVVCAAAWTALEFALGGASRS